MTEDEEFKLLEDKQKLQSIKIDDRFFEAALAAQQFIDECTKEELSITTLRCAFEMGFKKGKGLK